MPRSRPSEPDPPRSRPNASSAQDPDSFLPMRPVEFYILLALADSDCHGYGIIQATLERSGGTIRLDPGTLYRAITRLKESGLLAEADRREAADLANQRRRYYGITELGRRIAAAEAERMSGLVEDARLNNLLDEKA